MRQLRLPHRIALQIVFALTVLLHTGSVSYANDEGIVALTPASARVQTADIVSLDITLDFTPRPALAGGFSINWDPALFEFVAWDISGRTIVVDPAFDSPPTLSMPGRLSNAMFGNTSGLTPTGVLATLQLRALAPTCGGSINITDADTGNLWLEAATLNPLEPSYRRARIAVGSASCLSPPLADDVADMPGRCIAVLPVSRVDSCPEVQPSVWSVSRLFKDLNVNPPQGVLVPLAPHMARYCVYDREPGATQTCEDLAETADRIRPGIVVQSATMAAAVQGGSLDALFKPALQSHFLEQSGALSQPFNPGSVVRFGLIDTMSIGGARSSAPERSPTRAGGPDTIPVHGDALRRFSSALLSGIDFTQSAGLALPFNCFRAQTCLELCGDTEGCPTEAGLPTGFLGTPESVARGVHDAVFRWSGDPLDTRLVINASLGWRPQFNLKDGVERAGYRALLDSLKEAACLGAVVIASAGNENSGPGGAVGLLAPANDVVRLAPDATECSALGYQATPLIVGSGPRPLVYPVGAVDAANQPLLARIGAEPPLVAFGDHASLLGPVIDGGLVPALTGTSVASLVVSAAATAVWSVDPTLSPSKVMEIIRLSATPLGRTSPVCVAGQPCPETVARVSVCEAYAAACNEFGGGMDCPVCTPPDPVQIAPGDAALDDMELTLELASAIAVDLAGAVVVDDADTTVCNGGQPYTLYQPPSLAPPLNPCPHDQFYATLETPWATGQPEHQSCENCSMTERSPGKLLVEINDSFGSELDNPTLLEATLLCRDRSTGAINAFRLPDTDASQPVRRGFTPGEQLLINNVPNDLCAGDDIRLAFRVDAGDAETDNPASLVQQLIVIRHDEDNDDVPDFRDNCTLAANRSQLDSDGDGYGNACDGDINQPNDCVVNVLDLAALRDAFFATPGAAQWNPDADFNGDGVVNVADLGILRTLFFQTPGPSGLASQCDAP